MSASNEIELAIKTETTHGTSATLRSGRAMIFREGTVSGCNCPCCMEARSQRLDDRQLTPRFQKGDHVYLRSGVSAVVLAVGYIPSDSCVRYNVGNKDGRELIVEEHDLLPAGDVDPNGGSPSLAFVPASSVAAVTITSTAPNFNVGDRVAVAPGVISPNEERGELRGRHSPGWWLVRFGFGATLEIPENRLRFVGQGTLGSSSPARVASLPSAKPAYQTISYNYEICGDEIVPKKKKCPECGDGSGVVMLFTSRRPCRTCNQSEVTT